MRNLQKILGVLLTGIFLVGLLAGCKPQTENRNPNPAIGKGDISDLVQEPEDGVVASVNGEDITKDDVDAFLPILRYIYQKNPGDDDWDEFYTYAVEYLASGKLYTLLLDEYDLSIDETELEKSMEEVKASAGGENEFYEEIRNYDVTEDMVEEFLRYNMAYTLIYVEATKDVSVSDEEIEKYFEENKDSFTDITRRDFHQIAYESKEAAEADLKAILSGEKSFDDLAGEDKGFVASVEKGDLTDDFEDLVWELEEDEIYDKVVESSKGYHIITARNFYENHTFTLDEVKDTIKTNIEQQKQAEAMDKLVSEKILKYKLSVYWNNSSEN